MTIPLEHSPKECTNYTATTTESTILLIGNEEWLERPSLWGFRLWHVIFIFLAGFLGVIICLCCCIRVRIPRTKQEIEADYVRKKITRKFRKQLRMIQNQEMDEMDLRKALDRIRAEFKSDTESIAQSEGLSGGSVSDGPTSPPPHSASYRKASELGVDIEHLIERRNSGLGNRFSKLVGNFRLARSRRRGQTEEKGKANV